MPEHTAHTGWRTGMQGTAVSKSVSVFISFAHAMLHPHCLLIVLNWQQGCSRSMYAKIVCHSIWIRAAASAGSDWLSNQSTCKGLNNSGHSPICLHAPCTSHLPPAPHVAFGAPVKPSLHLPLQLWPAGAVELQSKLALPPGTTGLSEHTAHRGRCTGRLRKGHKRQQTQDFMI